MTNPLTRLLSHRRTRPAPRSPRELLLALGAMPVEFGIDDFLDRFDFTGVTPHQVYYSVLGRLPESVQVAAMPPGYDARQHTRDALLSAEFQSQLIVQVLQAFPEKKRVFFVHVPKCAGTDLCTQLIERYPGVCLEQKMLSPDYVPMSQVLWRLRALGARLCDREEIVVMGHFDLNGFLSQRLIRYGDTVFSVIREPLGMALSLVNYALTLIERDPKTRPLVAVEFAKAIGLSPDTHGLPPDPAERKRLALQMLHSRAIMPVNNLCRALGRNTFASALDLCASANIELTTVSRYEAWLHARWGIPRSPHANRSRCFLTADDLGEADLAHLRQISSEDQPFYDHVDQRLAAIGRSSIFGVEL